MSLHLLFECLSEEVPSKMHDAATKQMYADITNKFDKHKISFDVIKVFITSRRLILFISDINVESVANSNVEVKGPKTSSPQQAIEGFLRKTGKTLEDLIIRKIKNEDFYFIVLDNNDKIDIEKTVKAILEDILHNFSWPKTMRWSSDVRWVRPILSVLCLLGDKVLPIEFAGFTASNQTVGHRFLSSKKNITVSNFTDYATQLNKNHVIFDQDERLKFILQQINDLTTPHGLVCESNLELLHELNGIVEYPLVVIGKVDQKFCNLPQELVLSVMHNQQRYLAVFQNGQITNFIAITSIASDKVVQGHERVLNARLTDASFLIAQDLKQNLSYYIEKLKGVLFHAKLGTIAEKAHRITVLAKYIAIWIPRASLIQVERAAQLAKADLAGSIVKEFPELQGIMGSYYASYFGEEKEVCEAIVEHYRPINQKQPCPSSPISIAIAIADKVDSLVGLVAAGEKVSGSRDPFALRRMAIGLVRLITENGLHIPIKLLIEKSVSLYSKDLFGEGMINMIKNVAKDKNDRNRKSIVATILNFCYDRFTVILKEKGIRIDVINAVFSHGEINDLLLLEQEAAILNQYLSTENGAAILSTYKRVNNLINKVERFEGDVLSSHSYSKKLLVESAEVALSEELDSYRNSIKSLMKNNEFLKSLDKVYEFHDIINKFMDNIKINDNKEQELRKNRLSIIINVRAIFNLIANFNKIENI